MGTNLSCPARRGFLCCCKKNGGVTTILSSLAVAGAMIGVSLYQASADDMPAAQAAALTSATVADCLGAWNGHASGGNLPPEGVDFLLTLEDDGEGGITGTLDGGDQGAFDVVDGTFDEATSVFSCWIVNSENPEMAAEMSGTVDNGSMSGAIVAGDMQIDFDATKG
jgi:hypothetical protein